LILAGDLGGTKTFLARFEIKGGLPGPPLGLELLQSANYPSFEALLREYLARHPGPVEAACFGIAGAVVENCVRVTNLPWIVDGAEVTRELKLERVRLINDLVATGYGIAALRPGEMEPLQPGDPASDSNAGMLAAGTGLGESILVRVGRDYLPVPSEGGHADFAPRTDDELRVFRAFRARHGRVSYERVLSGPGLVALGELFHGERSTQAEWARHLEAAGEEGAAEVVSTMGMAGSCPACEAALRLFVGVYGAEAGNMALRAVARGGIYLGGGIAPKILPALKWDVFLEAFRDKEHLRPLLSSIPVWVILNPRTGLLGAARRAAMAEVDAR
jgi:glucokinase